MRIGVIADSHVAIDERAHEVAVWHNPFRLVDSLDRLAVALEHPHVRDADLVVVLGDLAHFGDRASVSAVVDAVASCTQPVVLLSGNHDVIEPGVRLEDEIVALGASHVWSPKVAPVPSPLLSLFKGEGLGLQVVEVMAEWPAPDQPFAVEGRTVIEGASDAPGVTLTHFPLLGFQARCEGAGLLYAGHLDQLARRPDLDRGWSTHLVLSGHLHLRAVSIEAATMQLSFAALVEAPYEVAAVDVVCRGGALDVSYDCTSVRAVSEDTLPVLAPPADTFSLSTQ